MPFWFHIPAVLDAAGAADAPAGLAHPLQHELAELLAADVAGAADVEDGGDIRRVAREMRPDQAAIDQAA